MTTNIKQAALGYVPDTMLHCADLPKISVNLVLDTVTKTNQKGEDYVVNYFESEGKKYAVPNKVLELIQAILQLKADVQYVNVTRTGTGLATKYKVFPVE